MTFVSKFKKRFYFVVAGYFRFFANHSFKRWHPRVIAITGSVGKTTMLHLVEQQLGSKAHYSHDANSAYGIAFDIINLRGVTGSKWRWLWLLIAVPIKSLFYRHSERFYVVEIDGERPHETEFLASWLKPEITLWISLGRSHAVQFEHQVHSGEYETLDKAITHEFAMLPQYTQKEIYIDGDIRLMKSAVRHVRENHHITARVTECYKKELKKYSAYPDRSEFTIGQSQFKFSHPMPRDIAIQLVMLGHLANYLKIPLKTDLTKMPMPPGRNSYLRGKNGLRLIDSSYNAHLISMESILDMAKQMKAPHKWLVLGDMVEQGSIESEEHTALADLIASVKPEKVILVGRRTKKYTAPRLIELGISTVTTSDPKKALRYIEENTTGQETIIFKGSQYLEWIIEQLLADPADAAKLPRREKAATKRRAKRGLN